MRSLFLTAGYFIFCGLLGALSLSAQALPETKYPCVAVAMPQAVLKHGDITQDVAIQLQSALTESLQQHGHNALPVPSRHEPQLTLQAREMGCEQIILTALDHQKKSRWRKSLSIGLSAGSNHSSGGIGVGIGTDIGKSSSGTRAGGTGDSSLASAQRLIHEDDSITLSYKLQRTDQQGTLGKREFKMKSRYDGEDVLGPLLEQVSAAVTANLAN